MALNEAHSHYTVLVVEADGIQRALLKKILGDLLPCVVVEAPNGEVACNQARVAPPDLVLLDMQVPPHGGLVLLQRLRSTMTPQVPVIILTNAHASDERLMHSAAVISSYVTKPHYLDALEDAIREVLGVQRTAFGGQPC